MRTIASALLFAGLLGTPASVKASQEVDTIRVGDSALHDARLRLGTEAIKSFKHAGGVDRPNSTTTQAISRSRLGDEEVYVIRTTHASAAGDTTIGTIVVRTNDFALLHHKVKAEHDSAAVTANDGHLTGWVVLPGQPVRLIDLELDHRVFPIEGQMPWLFPLLPLAEGYAAAIPHFSEWSGGEEWATIRVLDSEPIEHAGATLDCWRVDAGALGPPGYRATHWVEKETGRIVRSALRGEGDGPEWWSVSREP